MYRKILLLLLFLIPFRLLSAQDCTVIGVLPKGYTPEEVGQKLAYRFVDKGNIQDRKGISYFYTFNWNGDLKFAEVANDTMLFSLLQKNFEPLFNSKKQILPGKVHVDMNMFGCLPLEFYHVTKDQRYYNLGISYADTQWQLPDNAKQYENGLFYHAPDVPFYWGRGDGWMAVGMTELLLNLPESDTNYQRIYKGYRLMMESLKKYVNQDGVWNQLIDVKDCWTETSGSAMFTYAMIIGVKNGWLDADEYGPIIRRAWMSLCNFIDDKNDVTEVCIGTGKKNSYQYYLDRPRIAGDYHGQAPMIWCATALLED